MTYKLRRTQRLTTSREINRVLSRPNQRKNYGVIRVIQKSNTTGMSRLALGIAKRHVRLAVRRNLMKRIIREWFRLNQNDLPANDLMFVATPQVNRITTRSDLRAHLVSALESVVADLQKDRI